MTPMMVGIRIQAPLHGQRAIPWLQEHSITPILSRNFIGYCLVEARSARSSYEVTGAMSMPLMDSPTVHLTSGSARPSSTSACSPLKLFGKSQAPFAYNGDRSGRTGDIRRFGFIDVLLLCVAAIWGLNFAAVKWALTDLEPLAHVGFRMALSTTLFFLVLRFTEGNVGVERQQLRRLAVIGIGALAVNQALFVVALRYTTALNAALIYATAPVYGLLLSGLLAGEKVGIRQYAGLAVAFGGVLAVIAGGSNLGELLDGSHLFGDGLMVVASIAWSLYSLLAGPLLARSEMSPLRVNSYTYLFATAALVPVTTPSVLGQDWGSVGVGAYGSVLYSAALSSVVAFVFWYRAVRQIGVPRTMIYQYLVLVFGVLGSALLLQEAVTLYDLAGGAVILLGIAIARSGGPSLPHRARTAERPREVAEEGYAA